MIRELICWWQKRREMNKTELRERLDRIDHTQVEIGKDLAKIQERIDPLRQLIEGLRQEPHGFSESNDNKPHHHRQLS